MGLSSSKSKTTSNTSQNTNEVTHGTQVTAIDERDRVPVLWTQGTPSADFAEDIHQLLEGGP